MGVFEDFIYAELPQRPVIIKGADEATGDPNISALPKVNGSPVGTFYLQDDSDPKMLWQKKAASSTSWEQVGSGAGGSSTFLDLEDTPESFSGNALNKIRVNPSTSALEFTKDYLSVGMIEAPGYTDLGNGSITIDSGSAVLYDNSNYLGNLNEYSISSNTFSLVNNDTNYIIVNYNAGTPIYQTTIDVSGINESDIVPVYTIYRNDNDLHILDWNGLGAGLANKLHARLVKTRRFERESGLSLNEYGTRNFAIGSGIIWYGANKVTLDAISSSITSTETLLHYHDSGSWASSSITQYNNTQYDDGTDLQTLSDSSRYTINWIYRCVEDNGHIHVVLGNDDYTQTQAEEAQPPGDLPDIITKQSMLIGRIIVNYNATSAHEIDSAFELTFAAGNVTSHNNLADIQGGSADSYYHMTSEEYANVRSLTAAKNVVHYGTGQDYTNFGAALSAVADGGTMYVHNNVTSTNGILNLDKSVTFVNVTDDISSHIFNLTTNINSRLEFKNFGIFAIIGNDNTISQLTIGNARYFDENLDVLSGSNLNITYLTMYDSHFKFSSFHPILNAKHVNISNCQITFENNAPAIVGIDYLELNNVFVDNQDTDAKFSMSADVVGGIVALNNVFYKCSVTPPEDWTTTLADNLWWVDNNDNIAPVNYSLPIGIHNDLTGLQGGSAGSYYHMTSEEYTNIQTLSAGQDIVHYGTGQQFTNFASALSAVTDGGTIYMHDDVTISNGLINQDKNVTFININDSTTECFFNISTDITNSTLTFRNFGGLYLRGTGSLINGLNVEDCKYPAETNNILYTSNRTINYLKISNSNIRLTNTNGVITTRNVNICNSHLYFEPIAPFFNDIDYINLSNVYITNTGTESKFDFSAGDVGGYGTINNVFYECSVTPPDFTNVTEYDKKNMWWVNAGTIVPVTNTLITNFIQNNDTPANYTDDAYKKVRVNSTEDGLEFVSENQQNIILSDDLSITSNLDLSKYLVLNYAQYSGGGIGFYDNRYYNEVNILINNLTASECNIIRGYGKVTNLRPYDDDEFITLNKNQLWIGPAWSEQETNLIKFGGNIGCLFSNIGGGSINILDSDFSISGRSSDNLKIFTGGALINFKNTNLTIDGVTTGGSQYAIGEHISNMYNSKIYINSSDSTTDITTLFSTDANNFISSEIMMNDSITEGIYFNLQNARLNNFITNLDIVIEDSTSGLYNCTGSLIHIDRHDSNKTYLYNFTGDGNYEVQELGAGASPVWSKDGTYTFTTDSVGIGLNASGDILGKQTISGDIALYPMTAAPTYNTAVGKLYYEKEENTDSNTLLLLRADNGTSDMMSNYTVTPTNISLISDNPWDGTNCFRDSNVGTSYLRVTDADSALSPGNQDGWTLETWIKRTGAGEFDIIDMDSTGGTDRFRFYCQTSGILKYYVQYSGITRFDRTAGDISDGNWHHIVYQKSGNNHTLFIDGSTADTWSHTSSWYPTSYGDGFDISYAGTTTLLVRSDEIKISNVARYDGEFVVPSARTKGKLVLKEHNDTITELNAQTFEGLADTPVSLSADSYIKVNSAGTGIEYVGEPQGLVTSVNSETGDITLTTYDISESSNLYYTEARVNANTNVAANTTHRSLTNNPHGVDADDVNCLAKNNTTLYSPTGDYNPATKKYVDDNAGGGGGGWSSSSFNTSYTATTGTNVNFISASGGNITIVLPAAAGAIDIMQIFKKIDSSVNTITLDGNGSETIDGQTTYTISSQYDTISVISNGSEYFIV